MKRRCQLKCLFCVFLLLFLLLASGVFAASEITVKPVKNSVILTETASFELTLSNQARETQRYSLFSLVPGWDIEPSPLKDKVIELAPGQNKTTLIKAKAKEAFNPGIYQLAFNIETDLGEKYTETLTIYISPDKPLDYLPSIKVALDFEKKINPQQPLAIRLLLENKNPLNMPELTIRLQSDLPEFNQETTASLAPLEKKTVEFALSPNPFQKPGEYFLFFTFEKGGETVKVISQKVEILALTPPFQTDLTEEKDFLLITKTLQVRNTGNIRSTQSVTLPVTFWENLFSQNTPPALPLKEDSQRFLSWELTLFPNDSLTVVTVVNYRYPLYFLIFLLLLLAVYLYIRSPLALHKTAFTNKKDATLSELKITIDLKNLTNRSLKNVELIDLIPGIADLGKSLDVGTLKPQEIKHTSKGTLIKWKLAEIEPKEHRLFTYEIKSRLKIVGALKLPRAKAVYGPKTHQTAYSNTFRISS